MHWPKWFLAPLVFCVNKPTTQKQPVISIGFEVTHGHQYIIHKSILVISIDVGLVRKLWFDFGAFNSRGFIVINTYPFCSGRSGHIYDLIIALSTNYPYFYFVGLFTRDFEHIITAKTINPYFFGFIGVKSSLIEDLFEVSFFRNFLQGHFQFLGADLFYRYQFLFVRAKHLYFWPNFYSTFYCLVW